MIRAQGLTKRYGRVLAVDQLTFDVLPGRVTGFLGPNGAGKSTTMRMILGLDRPGSGDVTVLGRPYREHRRPSHEVGAVLDARAVHGGRTAYNHLLGLAQSNGIGARRVREVLDLVGLAEVAGRRIRGFSLGMSQRLGIASAMLGDPQVVLCDEPVNGLDPEGIVWIRTLLRRLAEEGRTVFVSSHLMSEMALMADHVIVIGRGRMLADTSVDELVRNAGQAVVTVRTPAPDLLTSELLAAGATVVRNDDGRLEVTGLAADGIGDLALRRHIALHELAPRPVSLESAYLTLTQEQTQFHASGAAS